jgi:putative Holliday junction resolvase
MPVVPLLQLPALLAAGTRLLGLDVGSKTIGLAASDVSRTIANPLATIARTRLGRDLERLAGQVADLSIGGFVVGLPIGMDGREGRRCQAVRQFARDLLKRTDAPLAFWDERLSTAAVERVLIGEADLSRRRRRQVVDKAAACFILQGALDRLAFAARHPSAEDPENQ